MAKIFKNRLKNQSGQTQRTEVIHRANNPTAAQHPSNIFNLPSDWQPLDSVSDTTNIPGTSLEIGIISRALERNEDERIELNQRRGAKGGCGHMFFSIEEIAGTCISCSSEAAQLLRQGLISQQQAEQHTLYCHSCASYCMGCFSQSLCARHTRLYQEPTGRVIPLCPSCYEQLNPKESILKKIIRFLIGK